MSGLSRERLAELVAQGLTDREIGDRCGRTAEAIKTMRRKKRVLKRPPQDRTDVFRKFTAGMPKPSCRNEAQRAALFAGRRYDDDPRAVAADRGGAMPRRPAEAPGASSTMVLFEGMTV